MGLLTRLGSIFARHPGGAAGAGGRGPDQLIGFDDAAEGEVVDEHPLEVLEGEESAEALVATRPVNLTRPLAKRTKQEWFDELQRNHQELVDLVRKFDSHLDREAERADRLAGVSEALGRALPAVERLSSELGERLDKGADRIADAIEGGAARAERHAERVEGALGGIGEQLQTSTAGQVELVTRLAEFRQTMSEMAHASAESTRILGEMSERDARRQVDLERRVASMRLWVVLGVGVALAVAAVAVTLGVVALITQSA